MTKKKNRNRTTTGWARTKWYPHFKHPAKYKKKGNDEIEYITFTHSDEVEFESGKKVKTIPLTDNISKKERVENKQKGLVKGENRSYAYPKVYSGKRSALGKESDEFSFVDEDKVIVDKLFKDLPRISVPKTGGSDKQKKKPRK